MKKLTIAAALILTASTAFPADWTGFRGSNTNGVSEGDYPTKFGPKENVRWKVDLPGRGLSNPIIVNGKVIVTCSSGYKQSRLHVLCLDEKTGRKQWERQFSSTGNTQCHPTTSMAAPTPVTDGKAVYALFATGDLAAVELDGTLRWYRSLVSDYPDITNQVGMASSPALYKSVLLLPMENAGTSFAAGLDVMTGKNLWKVERNRSINWVTPVVRESDGKAEAIFSTNKDITAYDPLTGKTVWSIVDRGGSDIPSPVQGDGVVFVPSREFLALKPRADGGTPDVVWKSGKLGGSAGASPIHLKDKLYAMTSVGLRCVDAKDGKELWLQRVPGRFWASPVIGGDKAYLASETGKVTVVKIGEKPEILHEVEMGQKLLASPALANGALYLRSDESLFCIGK